MRSGRLDGWCWLDQQRACKMVQASEEKLEHTGPAKKKKVASLPLREQLASTPELPLPKEKEQNRVSKIPDCKVGESCT